nr:MAG TPA: hypothetical protein [Caudoviricetes sp.]
MSNTDAGAIKTSEKILVFLFYCCNVVYNMI